MYQTARTIKMAIKQTLALIKPDVTSQGQEKLNEVVAEISSRGFTIRTICEAQWTRAQAEEFYAALSGEPFFNDLIDFMTSNKVVMLRLEGEEVVDAWRAEIGSTDPLTADPGTLRAVYGTSIEQNAFHGSDSDASAVVELAFLDTHFINPM